MKKLKFCFWGDIHSALIGETKGGGELQISLLAKGLSNLGHKVSIIDFSIENDAIVNNIEILSIKKRTNNVLLKNIYFIYLLQLQKANFYYGRIRSGIHIFAYIVARINKSKFVLGLAHDLDSLSFIDRYHNFYKLRSIKTFINHLFQVEIVYSFLLRKADLIIAQHEVQKSNLNLKKIKSQICYNIYPHDVNEAEGKYKKSDFYLFLGSLDKRKGIDDIEEIVTKIPERKFLIIGRCRDKYSMKKIDILKERSNVEYLGELEHITIANYLKKAIALISVSKMEGFPNTFIEAWAHGLPVLSLNVNPGNIMNLYKIGKCYDKDIELLINDLDNQGFDYNSKIIQRYVINHHNMKKNIRKFLSLMDSIQ